MDKSHLFLKNIKKHAINFKQTDAYNRIMAGLISALGGIIFGLLIMAILDLQGLYYFFYVLFSGSYRFDINVYIIGSFVTAAPIIITGLSIGFAFRTGLFNIGASGQVLVGGFTAIYVALAFNLPFPLHFIVAILAAIIAGGIWGLIIGLFKALFNVHEVVTSIMMNYIAAYLIKYLVKNTLVYESLKAQTKSVAGTNAAIPSFGLEKIFPNSGFDISIFIAIGVAIIMYILINKTTLGYQLKAVGFNKDASMVAGINYRRNIVISMAIAGALSGLAGAMIYLSRVNDSHIKAQVMIPSQGFDGISVALLAFNNPYATVVSAYFINFITKIGTLVEGASSFRKEISDVIVAIIIYFSALSTIVIQMLNRRKLRRNKPKTPSDSDKKE